MQCADTTVGNNTFNCLFCWSLTYSSAHVWNITLFRFLKLSYFLLLLLWSALLPENIYFWPKIPFISTTTLTNYLEHLKSIFFCVSKVFTDCKQIAYWKLDLGCPQIILKSSILYSIEMSKINKIKDKENCEHSFNNISGMY